jgi:hypothetical protein
VRGRPRSSTVLSLVRRFFLLRRLEHQPRASDALDALAASVVTLAGHDVHQAILLAGEGLQRPGQILTVQDEDDAVLPGQLFQGGRRGLPSWVYASRLSFTSSLSALAPIWPQCVTVRAARGR